MIFDRVILDIFLTFVQIENMNENTYNSFNEMRFPISFGISPDILLFDKYLNN